MIIIYGTGFVGTHITKVLGQNNMHYMCSKTRIHDYNAVKEEIQLYKPTAVINAAGLPTATNIDFYENEIPDLIITNTVGNLILASICEQHSIHYITIMSGCIFDGPGKFTDKDIPNFTGSAYSKNRAETETILKNFKNTCIVRIRMPVSEDFSDKSLITKLTKFSYITNLKNSITVLEDCMPKLVNIIQKRHVGIVNLVNRGTVSNAYICYLYKKLINHAKEFRIVRPEQIHIVPRSNCVLEPSAIVSNTPDANHSVIRVMKKIKRVKDIYC